MLTTEQKAIRENRVGASEIGAVLGIDDHCTPVELFMRKKGLARPNDAPHLSWGHDVESAILRHFARRQGYELLPSPGTLVHPTQPHLCCTPDGLGAHRGKVRDIQGKNVQEYNAREWGDPGTSQGPLRYVGQVTIELGVLRAQPDWRHPIDDEGDLAVSFGGRPPLGYPIPFNAELFGNLSQVAAKFVRDHLLTDKPPPLEGDRAALEYVKRRWPDSTGEVLEPTDEAMRLVNALRQAKADKDSTDEVIEQLQAQLCALIGEAAGFEGWCTWSVVKAQRKPVTDWQLVVEHIIARCGLHRDEVKTLVAQHTREETVKESYRRLTLAKTLAQKGKSK